MQTTKDTQMNPDQIKDLQARQVRAKAIECLQHASNQLNKASYYIDEYVEKFQKARTPEERQNLVNWAINHLVSSIQPNLGIDALARAQANLVKHDVLRCEL